MPEENKNQSGAQNKLGELFVEFSTKGLPSLLKNLNSVSASFLLGKNAATQFADTLSKPFKEAGNTAVGIGRMANALGTTSVEYQKLANYVKKYGVGEGIVNDVSKLQQVFQDWNAGFGGLPEGLSTAFGSDFLGLNESDYTGSLESIIQLLDDVRVKTQGINKDARNQLLRQLGISSDWGYLWDRGGFNLKDALAIPDDAIERNTKMQETINELLISLKNLGDTLLSKIAPPLTILAEKFTGFIQDTQNNSEKLKRTGDVAAGVVAGAAVGSVVPGVGTAAGAIAGGVAGLTKNAVDKARKQGRPDQKSIPLWKQLTDFGQYKDLGRPTGGAAGLTAGAYYDDISSITPPAMKTQAAVTPSDMNNISQTITITNQNNITGNNAQEIANEIAQINVQDIQYTQYQLQNLAGI